jgi:Na+-transporting NADH:ubiquinone oxidoreductase subunit B
MRRVLYSLIPIFLFSIYLYGPRVLLTTALTFALGIGAEYLLEKGRKKKVSEAVLVTCALYSLAMPPMVPLWITAIGIIFAVIFGKEVYGGFGRNIFNPAISGRLFIYIAFPTALGATWKTAGNFGRGVDVLSSATPLAMLRAGESVDLQTLLFGIRPGSIGESSTVLIAAAAVYLLITKTASYRIIISTYGSAALLTVILWFSGVAKALPPIAALLSGSLLFVTVFMATDPISAAKDKKGQWLYGCLVGCVVVLVRTFSGFSEGTSFGVFIGNTFASLIDEAVKKKPKTAKEGTKGSAT